MHPTEFRDSFRSHENWQGLSTHWGLFCVAAGHERVAIQAGP